MRITTVATCLTLLALGFGPCALAQNTNSGEIRGIVTDQSGRHRSRRRDHYSEHGNGRRTKSYDKRVGRLRCGFDYSRQLSPHVHQRWLRQARPQRRGTDGQHDLDRWPTEGGNRADGGAGHRTGAAAENRNRRASHIARCENHAAVAQRRPGLGQLHPHSSGAAGSGTGVAVNGNLPYYSNFLADGANTTLPA